jgi:hypothetical protein
MHPARPPSRLVQRPGRETPAPPGAAPPPPEQRPRRLAKPSASAAPVALPPIASSSAAAFDAKAALPNSADAKGDSYAQALSLLQSEQYPEAFAAANATFSAQTQILKSCLAANHCLPEIELFCLIRNAHYQLALAFQMRGLIKNANSAFQNALLFADKTKHIDLVKSQITKEIRTAYAEFRRNHRIADQQQHQTPARTPEPGGTLLPSVASMQRTRTTVSNSAAAIRAAAGAAAGVAPPPLPRIVQNAGRNGTGAAPPLSSSDLPIASLS